MKKYKKFKLPESKIDVFISMDVDTPHTVIRRETEMALSRLAKFNTINPAFEKELTRSLISGYNRNGLRNDLIYCSASFQSKIT